MPTKVSQTVNGSQNSEYEIPCSKCSGKTAHSVLSSVDIDGEESDGDYSFNWSSKYQIVKCMGCKTISFRNESSNSEDYDYNGEGIEYNANETFYPPRVEGRKGLGDDIHYLPSNVRRIYSETLVALLNEAPVLTGIGLRALIETVCKEKQAEGNNLFQKIDGLKQQGILTPHGAQTLHRIRTLGNDAAHEVKPHNQSQLGIAMDVVEHLLRDVYILPKQVAAQFED